MKPICWLGDSLKTIKGYSTEVRQEIGYNLDRVQNELEPCDWKAMESIGAGVKELRIHDANEYRVLYVAKFKEAIYVLHSFVKKTQQTNVRDINLGRKRYIEMINVRRINNGSANGERI